MAPPPKAEPEPADRSEELRQQGAAHGHRPALRLPPLPTNRMYTSPYCYRTSPALTGSPCFKAPVSKRYDPTEQDSATPPTARSSIRRPISHA
jgi:hypothetical protein